jgi:O-antigen/teichoic acid export membrane protein
MADAERKAPRLDAPSRLSLTRGRAVRLLRHPSAGAVLVTALFQLLLMGSGITVARMLGEANRGHLALLVLIPSGLAQFGTLGIPLALTYEIARDRTRARAIVRPFGGIAATQAGLVLAANAVILWLLVRGEANDVQIAGVVTLLLGPALLVNIYGLAILQGQQRFRAFYGLWLLPLLLYTVATVVLFALGENSLPLVTLAWTTAIAIGGASTLVAVVIGLPVTSGPPPPRRGMIGFGLRSLLGSASPVETFRIDQAVVGLFISAAALGSYVVATAFTNLPRGLAVWLGAVAYPDVAARHDPRESRRTMWRYLAGTAVLAGGAVVVIEIAAGFLVQLLFGDAFSAAVPLTRILMIGAFLYSLRRVLADAARGAGYAIHGSVAEVTSWAILASTIPPFVALWDAEGAAIAIDIAAGGSFMVLAGSLFLPSRTRGAEPQPAVELAAPTAEIAPNLVAPEQTAEVFSDVRSERRIVGRTFDTGVDGVWRNPVLLVIGIGVVLATMNGVRPVRGATAADVCFALATLALAPLLIIARPRFFRIPWWMYAAVAGIGFAVLVSTAASVARASNLSAGMKFAITLGVTPLLLGAVAASYGRVALLADLWLVGAVANCAVATSDFFANTLIGYNVTGTYWLNRAAGLTVHPNHLGLVAAMALPVALSRAITAPALSRRIAYVVGVVVLGLGVLASGSRVELIAGAAGLLIVPLLQPIARKEIVVAFAAATLAVALVAVAVPSARSHALVSVHRLTGGDPTASMSDADRSKKLRRAVKDIEAHPMTGTGFAAVRDAHDIYLQLLQAGGVLALPPFLLFAGGILAMGLRLRRAPSLSPPTQNLAAALTASMGVWLLSGLLSNLVYDRFLYLPAGLLFGFWFATRRTEAAPAAGRHDR